MKAYDVVTERIIGLLKEGIVPWKRPWNVSGTPKNLISDRKYNGINVFMLNASGYGSSYWLTYKQAREQKGYVKKGEVGYPVVFWKWLEPRGNENRELVEGLESESGNDNGKGNRIPLLRYYTVFNVLQCCGIKYPVEEECIDFEPIEECESVLENLANSPKIRYDQNRASYRPLDDVVNMPPKNSFVGGQELYATLFHELTHSTGHELRLNRKSITELSSFGSNDYGREELIAEMGASFLCAHCGIETKVLENSAAYIAGWLRLFRNDKRVVVTAAAQAQKAADYVLGVENISVGK